MGTHTLHGSSQGLAQLEADGQNSTGLLHQSNYLDIAGPCFGPSPAHQERVSADNAGAAQWFCGKSEGSLRGDRRATTGSSLSLELEQAFSLEGLL